MNSTTAKLRIVHHSETQTNQFIFAKFRFSLKVVKCHRLWIKALFSPASFWGECKHSTLTFLTTSVNRLRWVSPVAVFVCLEARLIAPRTMELPGKDRKDLAVRAFWSQWFCGPCRGDPGQTMHCDGFPERQKEEDENKEHERLAD